MQYLSYQSACMSVSVCICLFPISYKMVNPNDPWDGEGFRLKKSVSRFRFAGKQKKTQLNSKLATATRGLYTAILRKL